MAAVKEIPIAGCGTVWMLLRTGYKHLLVCDQFLFFGTMLPESLLNPNQFQAFGIDANDNPFDSLQELRIDCSEVFVPFDTQSFILN